MSLLEKLSKILMADQPKPKGEKFMEMETTSGQVLVADEFAAGNQVFLKTDEGMLELAPDTYELKDGQRIVVGEGSMIEEVMAADDSGGGEGDDVDMSEYVTKEELKAVLAEIDTVLAEFAEAIKSTKTEMSEKQKAALAKLKEATKRKPLKREVIDVTEPVKTEEKFKGPKNTLRGRVRGNLDKAFEKAAARA